MNCRKARALLTRFVAGDVPEKLCSAIEAHLGSCPACSREKNLLARSWELLDRYETPKVSGDFTPSLMRRIRAEQTREREPAVHPLGWLPGRSQWRLASALAACLVVAIALGIYWGPRLLDYDGARIPPPSDPVVAVRSVTDEEIVQDLEIYENLELLQNLDFLADFDVVENLDEPV